MLTHSDVTAAMPAHLKVSVTDELVDMVNNIAQDPEAGRVIRENFVSYSTVLREGRFKTEDYLHAVAYVSYKLMGYSNFESYVRTFPDRYTALRARNATDKDISAYVAAFNKNKLVNLILEQSLIPTWVLNQDAFQRAINVQMQLMMNSKSDMVKMQAANSLLTHLKKPEKKEVQLNIGLEDNSGMNELRSKLRELAEMQQSMIHQGMKTREIAEQRIIDAEVVEEGDKT